MEKKKCISTIYSFTNIYKQCVTNLFHNPPNAEPEIFGDLPNVGEARGSDQEVRMVQLPQERVDQLVLEGWSQIPKVLGHTDQSLPHFGPGQTNKQKTNVGLAITILFLVI